MQNRFAALTVNDLIDENTRSWNLNMQSAIFNDHGITSISRIPLSNTQSLINAFGIYTVKTAYNLYMEHFTVSTALTMLGD